MSWSGEENCNISWTISSTFSENFNPKRFNLYCYVYCYIFQQNLSMWCVFLLQMQLPDRIIVYELSSDDPTDMRYRVKVRSSFSLFFCLWSMNVFQNRTQNKTMCNYSFDIATGKYVTVVAMEVFLKYSSNSFAHMNQFIWDSSPITCNFSCSWSLLVISCLLHH